MKRIGGLGANLPCWVQVIKVVLFADKRGVMGVMVSEGLIDVAVIDDGLEKEE